MLLHLEMKQISFCWQADHARMLGVAHVMESDFQPGSHTPRDVEGEEKNNVALFGCATPWPLGTLLVFQHQPKMLTHNIWW